MTVLRRLLFACAAVLLCAMSACGGASGGGGGIGGTGLVIGPIEGFGSVVVEGIEFDTTTAEITLDGDAADAAALKLGMVVSVEGEIDYDSSTGVAEKIRFESLLRGPVESLRVVRRELTVLGSTIVLEPDVVLDGVVFDASILDAGIAISGFVDAAGDVRATRIERDDDSVAALRLFGLVRNANDAAETFDLRTLTIDYSNAAFVGGTASELDDGDEVRVAFSQRPIGGQVAAETVTLRPPTLAAGPRREVRTRGLVTEVRSVSEFVLDQRIVVRVGDETTFVGGDRGDIAVDRFVGLEGRIGRDGVVQARRIVLRPIP